MVGLVLLVVVQMVAGAIGGLIVWRLAGLGRRRRRRLRCELVGYTISGGSPAENEVAARRLKRAWPDLMAGKD